MANDSDSGSRFIMIPAPDRYEIDCWGNAVRQVVCGEWVRYDDHVTSVEAMRLEIERLEKQVKQTKEMLSKSVFMIEFRDRTISQLNEDLKACQGVD